jgi:tetratricopeptide (TPR) repeat protein
MRRDARCRGIRKQGLKMRRLIFVMLLALGSAMAAAAPPVPMPEAVATAQERSVLPRLRRIAESGESSAQAAAELKLLLKDLPRPTPLRGLVQYARAMSLLDADGPQDETPAAIEESIRLLPDYAGPLLVAANFYTYHGAPGRAADDLLRASRIDPAAANVVDDYFFSGLLRRLDELDETARLAALSERFLETGWTNGKPATFSMMALKVIEARADAGRAKDGAALVQRVVTPSSFVRLLTIKKFDPLREDVEAWAGKRLEKQWPIYLDQTRQAWTQNHDLEDGYAYLTALASAGHERAAVAAFLPLFDRPLDSERDFMMVFIGSRVADRLARLGRWDEAFRLFDRLQTIWPAKESALGLNISANRGRLLVQQGRFEAGIAALDGALADAARFGPEVNRDALREMHLNRACALEALGRASEEGRSATVVEVAGDPAERATLALCRNDLPAARRAMIDGLAEALRRESVIAAMQPPGEPSYDSDYSRTLERRWQALRGDKEVLAALSQYGRVLPEPANAAAPPEEPVAAPGTGS